MAAIEREFLQLEGTQGGWHALFQVRREMRVRKCSSLSAQYGILQAWLPGPTTSSFSWVGVLARGMRLARTHTSQAMYIHVHVRKLYIPTVLLPVVGQSDGGIVHGATE